MDGKQFDDMLRRSMQPRRSLFGWALVGATALLATPGVDARKKRKRKKQKPIASANEFGCLNVGDPCTSEAQCCSGICTGAKGKRRCQAHDTGGCTAGETFSGCGGADIACTIGPGEAGLCATTTGNAGFCMGPPTDYPCTTDLDCQLANGGVLGPRAACIRCDDAPRGTLCATIAGTPS